MVGCVLVKFPCVLIISALFLSGCGDSKIREMRSEFVDGCKSSGMKMNVCSCVFSKMQEEYTKSQTDLNIANIQLIGQNTENTRLRNLGQETQNELLKLEKLYQEGIS